GRPLADFSEPFSGEGFAVENAALGDELLELLALVKLVNFLHEGDEVLGAPEDGRGASQALKRRSERRPLGRAASEAVLHHHQLDLLGAEGRTQRRRLFGIEADDIGDERIADAVELLLKLFGDQAFNEFAHGTPGTNDA